MKLNKLCQFHFISFLLLFSRVRLWGEAAGLFSLGNIFFNPTTVINKYLTFTS